MGCHSPQHPLHSWATWRATAQRYGLTLTPDTFLAYAGTPARGILTDLCSKQGVTLDVDEVLKWKHTHYLENHVHTVKPIDPVVRILHAAKAQGLSWINVGQHLSQQAQAFLWPLPVGVPAPTWSAACSTRDCWRNSTSS